MISRTHRLYVLLSLTFCFFVLELAVGIWVNSVALLCDAFHMFSDVLSLLVALYAIKMAEKVDYDEQYSYGWQRAEVLGALINGVFLLALCFSILLESFQRFLEPVIIEKPFWILGVGIAGLLLNLTGLCLFHEHGHSHSHGGHSSDHDHSAEKVPPFFPLDMPNCSTPVLGKVEELGDLEKKLLSVANQEFPSRSRSNSKSLYPINITPITRSRRSTFSIPVLPSEAHANIIRTAEKMHLVQEKLNSPTPNNVHRDGASEKIEIPITPFDDSGNHNHEGCDDHDHDKKKTGMLNMRGVFLHVLGDAFASVSVIASSLVIIFATGWDHRYYIDPLISVIITLVIIVFSIPLIKSASYILLQGVPHGISLDVVRSDILKIPGILSIHDLHVWQLCEDKLVGSIHVLLHPSANMTKVQWLIQRVMLHYGVHSTTVQPEIMESDHWHSMLSEDTCLFDKILLAEKDEN